MASNLGLLITAVLSIYDVCANTDIYPKKVHNNQEYMEHEIVQGKRAIGIWGEMLICAHGVRVAGFQLHVKNGGGLSGLQVACSDGTVSHESKGKEGTWTGFQYCEGEVKLAASKHATGFKFRSDDNAGQNVDMLCNEGTKLIGAGSSTGTWDSADYSKCPKGSYFCGAQRRGDDTTMNQIRFLCCRPKREVIMTDSFIMGKTSYGDWSRIIWCKNSGQIAGFRLQVEDALGVGGDDTALNGIQLLCKDGTVTDALEGPFGTWRAWQFCDTKSLYKFSQYVTGVNFRSEKKQYGGDQDDSGGNNVMFQCTNRRVIDGQGGTYGTWDSPTFKTCPYESFPCGVQAKIERNQYKGDDTALNQLKIICCKVEKETCPIIVEPLGCWKDYRNKRAMPNEILNERDPYNPAFVGDHFIDWFNFPVYLPEFRCRCAQKAAALGYKAFGIQFYAECWTGNDALDKYAEHGPGHECVDTSYKHIVHPVQGCPVQTGVGNSNFVYRISSVDANCNVGYAPIGCYEDIMDIPRPVPNYDHNERDDTIPGFNGIYIDWENWNTYMPRMICRCAEAARKLGHEIFSIQYWGECWTSFYNETEYDRDGRSTRCRGKDYKPCPCNSYHCVGMAQSNYVYRVNAV